jgi:hypothetical protein
VRLFVSVSPGTADNRRVVELFSYCMVELYVLFDLYGSGNRWELPSGCGSTYGSTLWDGSYLDRTCSTQDGCVQPSDGIKCGFVVLHVGWSYIHLEHLEHSYKTI